jgi:iron complex transport system ATP-binding protein
MAMPVPALLWTINLDVGYTHPASNRCLFRDLNFMLHAGELVCLMGPNGIGKSTLLRTLAGLHAPLSGSVHVPGKTIRRPDPLNIAIVLTERPESANLVCHDLVGFGRYPYMEWTAAYQSDDLRVIGKCLAAVGLAGLQNSPVRELSDGQMQMALIARALAQETPVLLLDEPSAHLDLNNRLEIMKLLRRLARSEGKAILMSTHELDLALQLADRVLLAGANEQLLQGIPEDLVLNGSFDEVFRLKGFDLKTGRLVQEASGDRAVQLSGTGHEYLWTKNALERNGIHITDNSPIRVSAAKAGALVRWTLEADSLRSEFASLEMLIQRLRGQP